MEKIIEFQIVELGKGWRAVMLKAETRGYFPFTRLGDWKPIKFRQSIESIKSVVVSRFPEAILKE